MRIALVLLILLSTWPIYADTALQIAQAEVGHGEEGRNNCGPDIRRYLDGKQDLAWCAGFISYILQRSGYTRLKYALSARALLNQAKELGLLTDQPGPGDLIVFWRGSPTSWQGHIGIIEKTDKDSITTIEGNVGPYPAKVARFTYKKNQIPRFLAFIDLSPTESDEIDRNK